MKTPLAAAIFVIALALPVFADEMSLTGRWEGRWNDLGYSGSVVYTLVHTGRQVSGRIAIRDRPSLPRDYETAIEGKVEGTSARLEYTTIASRVARVTIRMRSADELIADLVILGVLGSGGPQTLRRVAQ